MSDREKLPWLKVRNVHDLPRIYSFVRFEKVWRSNTYSGPMLDRNGNPYISFGHDEKPNSDWGRYRGPNGYIWFANSELADAGEKLVAKALVR